MLGIRILNTSDNPNPAYKHEGDAGFDLYCNEDLFIGPRSTVLVDVGLRIEIPFGYEGQLRLRSSYAKKNILISNAPGTIDCGYKGPIMVPLLNLDPHEPFRVKKGERFAQMVINELPGVTLESVTKDEFFEDETDRGEGGFGSTGQF